MSSGLFGWMNLVLNGCVCAVPSCGVTLLLRYEMFHHERRATASSAVQETLLHHGALWCQPTWFELNLIYENKLNTDDTIRKLHALKSNTEFKLTPNITCENIWTLYCPLVCLTFNYSRGLTSNTYRAVTKKDLFLYCSFLLLVIVFIKINNYFLWTAYFILFLFV